MSAEPLSADEWNALTIAEKDQLRADRAAGKQKASYLPDIHRLLPQSPDAERGVLSSWMIAPDYVGPLLRAKFFSPDWFHLPAHQQIAAELEAMGNEGHPVDFITLTQRLRDKGTLDQVGGAALITELSDFLPTAANTGHYAETLEEKWTAREIIKICTEATCRAYDEQDGIPALLAETEAKICGLSSKRTQRRRKGQGAVVMDIMEMIEHGDEEAVWGIKTGFPNIDMIARGLRPGNVIAIGGEEKAGKTALVQNIIAHVSVMAAEPVSTLFFSLENTTQEVNEELLQIISGYNLDEIMRAQKYHTLDGSARILEKTIAAGTKLAKAPLDIQDDAELSIVQMRALARQSKPRIIVLDYAQLCAGVSKRYERDDLRIAEVSRQFKLMCGELDATGFLLSQLNEDGKAAGSKSIVKDCNQWWIVEDGESNDAGQVITKNVKVCAGRRVQPADCSMRWIGHLKKMLPRAI